jgi:MSHA pilin protein MshA
MPLSPLKSGAQTAEDGSSKVLDPGATLDPHRIRHRSPRMYPKSPSRLPRHQAGFTLVELVTVILILGVLAAVALPRYADLQGKARESKVKAVAGSVKAANGLVKASAMANGVSCASASGTSVTMEGTAIDLNHCYPQALGAFATGILAAANVAAADGWAISTVNTGGANAGDTLTIELSDAGTPANCSVTFTSAAAANTPPVISTTVTGC